MLKIITFTISFIAFIMFPFNVFNETQAKTPSNNEQFDDSAKVTSNLESSQPTVQIQADPQIVKTLEDNFSDWQQWIILTPEHPWEPEELILLSEIITAVTSSLDEQGFDSQTILKGYRFKRQHGEYITDHEGRLAVVNHTTQEITLTDAAFKRLHGFYIIHELGHALDHRTGRQLTATFHNFAGSDMLAQQTAPDFWLNIASETDLEEATADAFALWIMSTHDAGYKPVFAFTPTTTNYEAIIQTFDLSLSNVIANNSNFAS